MNYIRKYRNRFITKIELVSALDDLAELLSPPDGMVDTIQPAEYNGIYFTLSSADLSQKSKTTSAGTFYTTSLEFSLPNFPGGDEFQNRFSKLAEFRITLSSGAEIRINRNDISLNSPIDVEWESDPKTIYFSTEIAQLYPLKLDE